MFWLLVIVIIGIICVITNFPFMPSRWLLLVILKNDNFAKFYIKYILQRSYTPVQLRNYYLYTNTIPGQLVGGFSTRLFEVSWGYIQSLGPVNLEFSSLEQDIAIAGYIVYSRIHEDTRYYNEPLYFYPQMSKEQVFDICFGEVSELPLKSKGTERLIEIINTIGHHALVEKDINFDGKIVRLGTSREFDQIDWRCLTDRFKKYL